MKKLVVFLIVLLISIIPVAGNSLKKCCWQEKKWVEPGILLCDPDQSAADQQSISLITHYLYTF